MEDKIVQQQQPLEWKINVDGEKEFNPSKFHKATVSRAFKCLEQFVRCLWWTIWKTGADDPRRLIHSVKVGIALSVVSLFYFMRPLFDSTDGNAIWAVMTVVVVFEFSVGATLSKGLNRCFATLVAGSLGVGVGYLAQLAGEDGGKVLLGVSVFASGAASTFSRFFPKIKKRYDYGVVIFILTFSLIAISSYRVEKLFRMAYQRLATIMIGCALCFLISILVFPIWAGDDLHDLIVTNLEALAGSIEGIMGGFFKDVETEENEKSDEDKASNGYKCVLNSKTTEESWANFATWEPCHGEFQAAYPWNEYVKFGAQIRYCAYSVEALHGLLNSDVQAPFCLKEKLKTPCMNICRESAMILCELAESMRSMTRISYRASMMHRLATVVGDLQNSLNVQHELFIDVKRCQIAEDKDSEDSPPNNMSADCGETIDQSRELKRTGPVFAFMETLPLAAFACLLIEIAERIENLILAVDKLAEKAKFKSRNVKEHLKAATVSPPKEAEEDADEESAVPAEAPIPISSVQIILVNVQKK